MDLTQLFYKCCSTPNSQKKMKPITRKRKLITTIRLLHSNPEEHAGSITPKALIPASSLEGRTLPHSHQTRWPWSCMNMPIWIRLGDRSSKLRCKYSHSSQDCFRFNQLLIFILNRQQEVALESFQVENYGQSWRCMIKTGDMPYTEREAYTTALNSQPDIVIIQLGTNDSKP